MKKILAKVHHAAMTFLKWGWPLVLASAALDRWAGDSTAIWRAYLNDAAFAWVLCAPLAPITLLLDRSRRERAMARLCGLREGDERERAVTGEAARASLLLALSLQSVLLVMTMTSVRLEWDPLAKTPGHHGMISVGLSFESARHLDPFGTAPAPPPAAPSSRAAVEFGGFLLAPSAFPVLALLILIELAAFKAFSLRRYEGMDA